MDHASDDTAVLKAKALLMMTDFRGHETKTPESKVHDCGAESP